MGKTKRKAVEVDDSGDYTDALRSGPNFTDERTHVMDGERRVTLHTIRRRSPALGWSWLSQSEKAALVRYADLVELADVTVKGCLAPASGGDGLVGAERRMNRSMGLESARRACAGPALAFTDKALLGDNPPTLEGAALDKFGSPRDAALMTARAMIGITAGDLVRYFGT